MARKQKIKRERGANWEPKIRERKGRGTWLVDLGTKFNPRFIYCQNKEEAQNKATEKRNEFIARLVGQKQAEKEKAAFNWFNLENAQQNHLATAFSTVNGDTAKILRALRFYEKHTSTADASRKLADVNKEYIAAKDASGKRPRTIRDAKGKLAAFDKVFGMQSISEISTADVEGWLNDQKFTPSTRNAYRVALSGLFNHAVKRRYTEHNPAAAIEVTVVDQGLPVIHTVEQVSAMLNTAAKLDTQKKRSKLVPYLAIGYFAGLRPENELVNLDWKDIDFEAKTIRVSPATAKKRRQRYVDMTDNLVAWLTPYALKSGKIGYSRRLFREVREDSKVDWSKDVMRHSLLFPANSA